MIRRLAGAAVLALGCQGVGVPDAELVGETVAVAWREPELARRRAEHLVSQDPERARRRHDRRWNQVGVVPVDEVQALLEGVAGAAREPQPLEHAPRLAFLDPRTRVVTPIDAALPGARPLDWSPDRQRLLFSQRHGRTLQLFEYDLVRDEVRPRTAGESAVHAQGCYGPAGRLVVAATSLEDGELRSRIRLTGVGAAGEQALSSGPRDHSPACAPDGSQVVYVSRTSGGRDRLVALPLAGERVPRPLGPGRAPAFSADGEWVVFSARIGGQWQLWRIRPDGSGRARIGRGVLDETEPAVSPDGRHVAYVVEDDFRSALYLRRMDGSGDRILFRDGDTEHPVW